VLPPIQPQHSKFLKGQPGVMARWHMSISIQLLCSILKACWTILVVLSSFHQQQHMKCCHFTSGSSASWPLHCAWYFDWIEFSHTVHLPLFSSYQYNALKSCWPGFSLSLVSSGVSTLSASNQLKKPIMGLFFGKSNARLVWFILCTCNVCPCHFHHFFEFNIQVQNMKDI